MGEFPTINPDELVQQEGPNKGNIADERLARIGAEAEDEARRNLYGSGKVHNPTYGSPNLDKSADIDGMDAMKDKVVSRAYAKTAQAQSGLGTIDGLDTDTKVAMNEARAEFTVEHRLKVDERKSEAAAIEEAKE